MSMAVAVSVRTLAELEEEIEEGLRAFLTIGPRLAEIRDRRLFEPEYKSFEDYCQQRWDFSRQRASQIIKAAAVSRILDIKPKRASHATALEPIVDQPEVARAAYAQAEAATAGKVTQAAVEKAVEHVTSKPSVRSERDAADNQALPDDDVAMGFGDAPSDPSEVINSQEPFGRPSRFCSQCGPFTGERCDCRPVVAGGSVPVDVDVTVWADKIRQAIASGAVKDGAEVAMDVPAICPAMPFDGNTNMQILRALHGAGLISSDDPWDTPRWTLTPRTAPVAAQETPDAAGGPASAASPPAAPSVNSRHASPSIGYRATVVDGVAPEPAYPTADGALNFVESHLKGEQLDEFVRRVTAYHRDVVRRRSQAAGDIVPIDEQKSDLRAALSDGRTILEIAEAIRGGLAEPTRVSLTAVLLDWITPDQLKTFSRQARAFVAAPAADTESPSGRKSVAQIESDFPSDLTSGERVTLAMRLLKPVDLKAFVTFESQVPMLRKEIGAREREAAKAAAV